MSKKKWGDLCLDWQRYKGEYLGLIFTFICFFVCIWFFAFRPISNLYEEGERSELKTEILRNIEGNISRISAKSKSQAEEIKNRLEAIRKDDGIKTLESITINQDNNRFEVVIVFGRD